MSAPDAPKPPPPPPAPPPPPEKPPEALEDAVDSTATALKKKRSGARGKLGRDQSGVQTGAMANAASKAISGLKIG